MKIIRSINTCILIFLASQHLNAQCSTAIATFPYHETFDINDGGWMPGGIASDWAWGIPTKPIINSSSTSFKCWITGGLAGSSYNGGENSWLKSPCFNFSSMIHPRIAFFVFWETEKNFDGASLQYSIDSGATWNNVGSVNEPACQSFNWFNNSSVNFLGSSGWSGNVQPTVGSCLGGSGSGTWLLAKHDLAFLAGRQSVVFRFRFGAGTQCNSYDGFAIDEIEIDEDPGPNADFTYTCEANNSISFSNDAEGCPTAYAWDFGDPASGSSNSSTVENPIHIFSSPGTYSVSLTVSFSTGLPLTATKIINVINASISVINDLKCSGDTNAALTAVVVGGTGPYNYLWNTTPPRSTLGINNLAAGNYTITVSGGNTCPTIASLSISEPAPLNATIDTIDALCGNNNGGATANVSGGTPVYSYLWSNNATTNTNSNLNPGNYSFQVTDANGCKFSKNNIIIRDVVRNVSVFLGNDTIICPGQSFVLNPGIFSNYLWHDNSTGATFLVTGSGTYSVRVTDTDGCKGTDAVNVLADCSDIFFPSAFTPDKNGLNDRFGAFGNIGAVKEYTFKIYHRWGELVFSSTNPAIRWDGTFKGSHLNTGSYAWIASYSLNGGPKKIRKGVVTLLH